MTTLCFNAIVKDESARIVRCLESVAPYIACWSISDTGSTDGTQKLIEDFFKDRAIPGELHEFGFVNFGQARNAALSLARQSSFNFDYLLFVDADMELVVEDPAVFKQLTAPAYDVLQKNSNLDYWNTRLLRRDVNAAYVGATHEYLSLPQEAERLHGPWFKDYADGANRKDKFIRDIRLLEDDLARDPHNPRSVFYLAQSYRDAGHPLRAIRYYARRVNMGGWEEETWYAQLQKARVRLQRNDKDGFVTAAVKAYNMRPTRAEPLYDLAHYYREKPNQQYASLLYSAAGMRVPYPKDDTLFVEPYPYKAGLREEFAICAFYDERLRDEGFTVCDQLALDGSVPEHTRALARANLQHYLLPLSHYAPLFKAHELNTKLDKGWLPLNPSVARWNNDLYTTVRTVNYRIRDNGTYDMQGDTAIRTRNYIARLRPDLVVERMDEILPPVDLPPPAYDQVLGFEDMRLFRYAGAWWCSATARELNPEGWAEQVLARIGPNGTMDNWCVMRPAHRQHEKNWMPYVRDTAVLKFAYDPYTLVDDTGTVTQTAPHRWDMNTFRGGSQVIPFNSGALALVHEAYADQAGKRAYQHRFVWYDQKDEIAGVSRPFYFNKRGIEFAAGLAQHPQTGAIVVSYGVDDREAWVGSLASHEITRMIRCS